MTVMDASVVLMVVGELQQNPAAATAAEAAAMAAAAPFEFTSSERRRKRSRAPLSEDAVVRLPLGMKVSLASPSDGCCTASSTYKLCVASPPCRSRSLCLRPLGRYFCKVHPTPETKLLRLLLCKPQLLLASLTLLEDL